MDPSDKLAIHELLARTTFGLDQRDADMIENCFTEQASFELEIKGADPIPPFQGRASIMKLMTDSMNSHSENRRHVVTPIYFESEAADSATVVSTLVAFQAEHGNIGVMTSGVYRDRLVRENGCWKIALRQLALDVPF